MNTLALSAPSAFLAKNKNIITMALFAAGKEQIQASTGKDSTLWFSMTLVGLAFAAVLGFTTKNWFAAIGGFFIGMIFMNVAAGIIGLS